MSRKKVRKKGRQQPPFELSEEFFEKVRRKGMMPMELAGQEVEPYQFTISFGDDDEEE
jgi:hypothetical protein